MDCLKCYYQDGKLCWNTHSAHYEKNTPIEACDFFEDLMEDDAPVVIPICINHDYAKISVGSMMLNSKKIVDLITKGSGYFDPAYIIKEWHMEEDLRVIDKAEIVEVSIVLRVLEKK